MAIAFSLVAGAETTITPEYLLHSLGIQLYIQSKFPNDTKGFAGACYQNPELGGYLHGQEGAPPFMALCDLNKGYAENEEYVIKHELIHVAQWCAANKPRNMQDIRRIGLDVSIEILTYFKYLYQNSPVYPQEAEAHVGSLDLTWDQVIERVASNCNVRSNP